jgi:hypothetical protein
MNSNIEGVFSDMPVLKDGLRHISFCADDKLAEDCRYNISHPKTNTVTDLCTPSGL